LPLSILKKWYKQLENDCPEDKVAVLFHFANGVKPFILIPLNQFKKLIAYSEVLTLYVVSSDKFSPAQHLIQDAEAYERVSKQIGYSYNGDGLNAVGFELNNDKVFIVFDAENCLKKMLCFEAERIIDKSVPLQRNISSLEFL